MVNALPASPDFVLARDGGRCGGWRSTSIPERSEPAQRSGAA